MKRLWKKKRTTVDETRDDPAPMNRSNVASNFRRVLAVATVVVGGRPEPGKRVWPSSYCKVPIVEVFDSIETGNNGILLLIRWMTRLLLSSIQLSEHVPFLIIIIIIIFVIFFVCLVIGPFIERKRKRETKEMSNIRKKWTR